MNMISFEIEMFLCSIIQTKKNNFFRKSPNFLKISCVRNWSIIVFVSQKHTQRSLIYSMVADNFISVLFHSTMLLFTVIGLDRIAMQRCMFISFFLFYVHRKIIFRILRIWMLFFHGHIINIDLPWIILRSYFSNMSLMHITQL